MLNLAIESCPWLFVLALLGFLFVIRSLLNALLRVLFIAACISIGTWFGMHWQSLTQALCWLR